MINSFLVLAMSLVQLSNDNNLFPNMIGGSGSLRTFTAINNEKTTFGAMLEDHFFSKSGFIDNRKTSQNQFRLSGNYTFDVGIPLEVFGGFAFTFSENSNSVESRTMTSFFENVDVGARSGIPILGDFWHVGGYAYVRGFSGTQSLRNTSGARSKRSGPIVTGELGAISTIVKSIGPVPLRWNLNLGYRAPNGDLNLANDEFNRFAADAFRYNAIVARTSIESPLKWVTPFVEFATEYAFATGSDNVSFSDNRQKLSLGVKVTPLRSMAILLAGDIGFGGPNAEQDLIGIPRNTPFQLIFGLAFQTLGRELIGKKHGSLRGSVSADDTQLPLSDVQITILGRSLHPMLSDSSGTYDFNEVPDGDYRVTYEKPGYEPVTRNVSLRDGQDVVLDVSLPLSGPGRGSLDATVLDAQTQLPIAKALVSATNYTAVLATDDQGRVRVPDLIEGLQSITVEAPGYASQSFDVNVVRKEAIQQTFALTKESPKTGPCRGVVKNAEGTPLTAVITSPDGSFSTVGTDPLSGEFAFDLPLGTRSLKIVAENYLPQTVDCIVVADGSVPPLQVTLEKPKEAVVVDDKIILPDAIYFEFNSSEIKSESFGILDQVAGILVERTDYTLLRIEGHTDSVGSNDYNQKLAQRRATSVLNYLAKKKVSREKMEAIGFGETEPIATNLTVEGRSENRRVEFNLVRK